MKKLGSANFLPLNGPHLGPHGWLGRVHLQHIPGQELDSSIEAFAVQHIEQQTHQLAPLLLPFRAPTRGIPHLTCHDWAENEPFGTC